MKKSLGFLVVIFFCTAFNVVGQAASKVLRINGKMAESVTLLTGWKYHAGDNSSWANPTYNDDDWEENKFESIDISEFISTHPNHLGWFRLKFSVPDSLRNYSWSLMYDMIGASEIYLNGKLIKRFGVIDVDPKKVKAKNLTGKPFSIKLTNDSIQVIAIRFAVQNGFPYIRELWTTNMVVVFLGSQDACLEWYDQTYHLFTFDVSNVIGGAFFILFILHACFYLYYPKRRYNLYYAIFTLLTGWTFIAAMLLIRISSIETRMWLTLFDRLAGNFTSIFYLLTFYAFFNYRKRIVFKSLLLISILTLPLIFYMKNNVILTFFMFLTLLYLVESFRIVWFAWKAKTNGTGIMLTGMIVYIVLSMVGLYGLNVKLYELGVLLLAAGVVINAVMMSMSFGLQIANTNVALHQKLTEVEKLSKEKQQILATQNETLEQQVTERTSQLKQSLEDLKVTQKQLIQSEKMASLGELTAGIAHEIQNPLNFVNNFSEINTELIGELEQEVDKGNLDEIKAIAGDLKENEQKISHHGKRADAIVKGMLQHSRANSGKKEPTDINALAEEYLRLSYHGLRANDKNFDADFTTNFDGSVGKIEVVPQDIGRVLLNLYNNAFYAVKERGTVEDVEYKPTVSATTKRAGDKVEITVKDNGNGIPQKVVEKIFQPFFTTKPTGQGTGLGLSLSYDIVKTHGGEIKVESKEGEGVEFIIQLPMT